MEFLLHNSDSIPAPIPWPLPLEGDLNNRTRVDREEHILETGLHRDTLERKDLPLNPEHFDFRLRHVFDGPNWASMWEWQESGDRAMERKERGWAGSNH